MARETRQQRRARRGEQQAPAPAPRARVRAAATPAPTAQPAPAAAGGRRIGGGRRFVGESWAELKKVEWPRQAQVISGTTVVLLACLIVGFYLYGADIVFKHLVHDVLLK